MRGRARPGAERRRVECPSDGAVAINERAKSVRVGVPIRNSSAAVHPQCAEQQDFVEAVTKTHAMGATAQERRDRSFPPGPVSRPIAVLPIDTPGLQ